MCALFISLLQFGLRRCLDPTCQRLPDHHRRSPRLCSAWSGVINSGSILLLVLASPPCFPKLLYMMLSNGVCLTALRPRAIFGHATAFKVTIVATRKFQDPKQFECLEHTLVFRRQTWFDACGLNVPSCCCILPRKRLHA